MIQLVAVKDGPISRRRGAGIAAGAAAALILFGGSQLLPAPARTNPPLAPGRTLEASVPVPTGVSRLLHRACADCHSNETHWPWYSRVSPFSWLIATDVSNARRAMNFSEWRSTGTLGTLAAACAAVEAGIMPPPSYRLLHPEARMSPAEKDALCNWTGAELAARGR